MNQTDVNTLLIVLLIFGKIAHFYYTKNRFDEQEVNTKHIITVAKLQGQVTDDVHERTKNIVQMVEDKVKVVEGKAEEVKQIAEQVASQSNSGTKLSTVTPPKP